MQLFDVLCLICAAHERRIRCVNDDEILASKCGNQVLWITGGDECARGAMEQVPGGAQRVAILVVRASFGKRVPRTDIQPFQRHRHRQYLDQRIVRRPLHHREVDADFLQARINFREHLLLFRAVSAATRSWR